ncbi:MAG TPA: PQQ-binding-like beta-propeller repeat protein [Gemmatimonadaceae bacterium]|nr:PQQ-binding-like beta-propeller repeat protein [Gemmatimonadaceae bacterium]
MTKYHRAILALALMACSRPSSVGSPRTAPATSVAAGDWPTFNRTLAGDRFSPLAEIDRTNVGRLGVVCRYALPEVTALQTGPIVVGGTMYFTTDTITYAIDAGTCAERWKSVRHSPTPSRLAVNRGAAYMDGRLFRGTSDAHVIAIDAADGHALWDVALDVAGRGVTVPMAPTAWNGLVYVGNAGGDLSGVTGHVYALDARDGHVVWKFDVVPASGPARATWPTADRYPISGGAFWTAFTLDERRGALYVAAGNPAPDFDIAVRDGENLYSNSLIALDATNGRLLAYNQLVKHDFHDWDVDSPAPLVTTRSGREIAASANKDGLLSVVDRGRVSAGALPLLFQVPTTTRENIETPLSRDQKTRFCPGYLGGSEWNGAAYHPTLNLVLVGANDWCSTVQLVSQSAPVPPTGAGWFGSVTQTMDPPANAKGWLTAFDAENGAVRWKFAATRPILAGVTPTAGGLVFAADLGGTLYAFDAANGAVLWQLATGQSMGGGIVSYLAGGRQLIGVAAGMKSPIWPGGSAASQIVVYGLLSRAAAAPGFPSFTPHEIATGLTGGYQVIAADLNRDGKPDLITVSGLPELLWFENPSWTRHVLARDLTGIINVAAADLDGDGIPEIAVASGFSTRPDQSSGIIGILTHATDPTQPWTMREIDRNPAAHRLRWYVDRDGQRWLMDAPLAAASAKPPNYDGTTPIYAYRAPDWKRESVTSAEFGVVHAIEPILAPFCDACLLTAGFAGIHRYEHAGGAWAHSTITAGDPAPMPKGGSSDVAVGRTSRADVGGDSYFVAAIEPWHGNEVAIYRRTGSGSFERHVIDSAVVDGHTLVTADLNGDGADEVIVGQRGGSRSVWVYSADPSSTRWTRTTLDEGKMAAAGCTAVDLNSDGRTDIVCIGTATANLKWYENVRP